MTKSISLDEFKINPNSAWAKMVEDFRNPDGSYKDLIWTDLVGVETTEPINKFFISQAELEDCRAWTCRDDEIVNLIFGEDMATIEGKLQVKAAKRLEQEINQELNETDPLDAEQAIAAARAVKPEKEGDDVTEKKA